MMIKMCVLLLLDYVYKNNTDSFNDDALLRMMKMMMICLPCLFSLLAVFRAVLTFSCATIYIAVRPSNHSKGTKHMKKGL